MILFFVFEIKNTFVWGFLLGAFLQGMTYRDRFVFLFRRKKHDLIYQKYKKENWGVKLREKIHIFFMF